MSRPIDDVSDPTLEQDDRFPSGAWEGYYLEPGSSKRFQMELHLVFRDGTLRGDGRDSVGEFLFKGTYEKESGKCWWTKRYIGAHDVAYQGYNEGRGIWGVWELSLAHKGGFHIWPRGQGSGEGQEVSEEADLPVLIGAGNEELRSESLNRSESVND
ncbi:hypothetical protein [Schlesneria sp.]|uniref:hypothetical protein n=1 Tax=Schlesneria sp. TaxID=2762018 RepID=UPI002EFFDE72